MGNLYVADGYIGQFTNSTGPALVYIGYTSLPLNDAFAAAAVITGNTTQVTAINANATKQVGEPNHAGIAGGHSLWWKWTAPADGLFLFSASAVAPPYSATPFTPLLAAYQGTSLQTLTPIASATSGTMMIQATANSTYRIAVDGPGSSTGLITLKLVLPVF